MWTQPKVGEVDYVGTGSNLPLVEWRCKCGFVAVSPWDMRPTCCVGRAMLRDGEVHLRDGHICDERWACHCEECSNHPSGPLMADERYSLGIYAGKMCDAAWKRSGYRDEPASAFDPADAGETW